MIFICVALFLVYFYPTFIAWKGQAAPAMIIFVINLFLGWTGIGWVVALIMSILNTTFKNLMIVTFIIFVLLVLAGVTLQ